MFAVYPVIINPTTDTDFRATGRVLHDHLLAVGWQLTGDAGQIDWNTVSVPSAGNLAGYNIYRSDDGAAGKPEMFLKMRVGRGTGGRINFLGSISVAGSDGNGNLNSPSANLVERNDNSTTAANPQNIWIGAGQDWFVMCVGSEVTNNGLRNFVISVERVYGEEAGSEFENAMSILYLNWSGPEGAIASPNTAYYKDFSNHTAGGMSGIASDNNPYAGNAGIGFACPMGHKVFSPGLNIIGAPDVITSVGADLTVNRRGVPVTYYTLPNSWGISFPIGDTSTTRMMLIRK